MTELINRATGCWPWFSDLIKRRLKTRRSVLIVLVGPAGEGKSYAAMKLCENFDRSFNHTRIVSDYEHFMELANQLRRGQFLMLDEPAYTLSHRRWRETLSQSIVDFLQTARFMGLGFVICAINRNLIEKTTRRFLLSFMGVLVDRGHVVMYHIKPSQFEDKVYHDRLGDVYLNLPSRRIYEPYEAQRDKIQRERYKQSLRQVRKEKRRILSDRELAELIEKDGTEQLMNKEGTRIDKFKVMAKYDVSEWKARNTIKLLERLG